MRKGLAKSKYETHGREVRTQADFGRRHGREPMGEQVNNRHRGESRT